MSKEDIQARTGNILIKLQVEIRDVESGSGGEGWWFLKESPEKIKERIRRQSKEWEDRAMQFIIFGRHVVN